MGNLQVLALWLYIVPLLNYAHPLPPVAPFSGQASTSCSSGADIADAVCTTCAAGWFKTSATGETLTCIKVGPLTLG